MLYIVSSLYSKCLFSSTPTLLLFMKTLYNAPRERNMFLNCINLLESFSCTFVSIWVCVCVYGVWVIDERGGTSRARVWLTYLAHYCLSQPMGKLFSGSSLSLSHSFFSFFLSSSILFKNATFSIPLRLVFSFPLGITSPCHKIRLLSCIFLFMSTVLIP